MNGSRKAELNRRLERLLILRRFRIAAGWGAGVVGTLLLAIFLVFLVSADLRAWFRNDRLGPSVETSGVVVAIYGGEIDDNGYHPQLPFVELADGRRVVAANPHRLMFQKGDRVIVEGRTYAKSGGRKYRALRHASVDG